MNENQKPFACTVKGCEMTFTNEDHLNWHQKKHDMMLNLGLTSKSNEGADQTPTPTRFIRNCEEVGLFQDLQNVNPFDEFFKKAVEQARTGDTLEVPESNSDDTLHTPHILPHIEERQKINNHNNQDDNTSHSNDFSLNSVLPIPSHSENACENNTTNRSSTPIIIIDDDDDEGKDIKTKIKEALQNKQKIEKENISSKSKFISVVPFHDLTIRKDKGNNASNSSDKSNTECHMDEIREKIREMNRAAQIRCRKRKQIRWKEMEEEIMILKDENKRLRMENYLLHIKLKQIEEKTSNINKDQVQGTIIGTLVPVTDNVKALKKGPGRVSTSASNSSKFLQTAHKKMSTPTTPNPIVIQIFPSNSNFAIPVLSSPQSSEIKIESTQSLAYTTSDLDEGTPQKKEKKKTFRKIIPKIIIEN